MPSQIDRNGAATAWRIAPARGDIQPVLAGFLERERHTDKSAVELRVGHLGGGMQRAKPTSARACRARGSQAHRLRYRHAEHGDRAPVLGLLVAAGLDQRCAVTAENDAGARRAAAEGLVDCGHLAILVRELCKQVGPDLSEGPPGWPRYGHARAPPALACQGGSSVRTYTLRRRRNRRPYEVR